MITNAIAEIRTFGEGFVIVDQAPNLLDTAAIRNTNTKIVLRLPEGSDRAVAGASMALSEKQIAELSKLPKGVAAIYQNEWQEAVLCKVDKFEKENLPISEKPTLYES
ncbi:MAG: ATP-binding protein, partial [Selenomonadaceae bacterium]|nr:ATP-binding protein [Selenomonadaceae bacterium]